MVSIIRQQRRTCLRPNSEKSYNENTEGPSWPGDNGAEQIQWLDFKASGPILIAKTPTDTEFAGRTPSPTRPAVRPHADRTQTHVV
jgi:hypothetical protein